MRAQPPSRSRRATAWTPGLLIAALAAPVWPQQVAPAPAPAPTPAVQETTKLVEEIGVLKAINPLHLSTEQIQTVLDLLKPGMEKLQQQDQANAKLIAPVITQLRQAAVQPNPAPNQT